MSESFSSPAGHVDHTIHTASAREAGFYPASPAEEEAMRQHPGAHQVAEGDMIAFYGRLGQQNRIGSREHLRAILNFSDDRDADRYIDIALRHGAIKTGKGGAIEVDHKKLAEQAKILQGKQEMPKPSEEELRELKRARLYQNTVGAALRTVFEGGTHSLGTHPFYRGYQRLKARRQAGKDKEAQARLDERERLYGKPGSRQPDGPRDGKSVGGVVHKSPLNDPNNVSPIQGQGPQTAQRAPQTFQRTPNRHSHINRALTTMQGRVDESLKPLIHENYLEPIGARAHAEVDEYVKQLGVQPDELTTEQQDEVRRMWRNSIKGQLSEIYRGSATDEQAYQISHALVAYEQARDEVAAMRERQMGAPGKAGNATR